MKKDLHASRSAGGKTRNITIIYCPASTQITLKNHVYQMDKGDLILVHPDIVWKSENILHLIEFSETFLDSLFFSQIADCKIIYEFIALRNACAHDYLYFKTDPSSVFNLLHLLQREIEHGDQYSSKLQHLLTVGIFTLLDRKRPTNLVVQNSTMIAKNRFGKILKYMGDHFAECTLQEAAAKFSYNPDYLSSMFKRITGISFSEKLRSIRLEESCRLLRATDDTIEEVSSIVGFKDKSYFNRLFKEQYQLTPAKWRKAQRIKLR